MDLSEYTPLQRRARTIAFKYMAQRMRIREVELGRKFSKLFRRTLCLKVDCDIAMRVSQAHQDFRPGELPLEKAQE